MSLVNFARGLDRWAPAYLLFLGFTAAAATGALIA
jgi:hypothetical protein